VAFRESPENLLIEKISRIRRTEERRGKMAFGGERNRRSRWVCGEGSSSRIHRCSSARGAARRPFDRSMPRSADEQSGHRAAERAGSCAIASGAARRLGRGAALLRGCRQFRIARQSDPRPHHGRAPFCSASLRHLFRCHRVPPRGRVKYENNGQRALRNLLANLY